jgi:hypothetical protein
VTLCIRRYREGLEHSPHHRTRLCSLCTRFTMSSDDGKHDVQTPPVDATMPELGAGSSRTQDLLDADSVDAVYRAKMHVVNDAMQEIGMGRYQVCLFVSCDVCMD